MGQRLIDALAHVTPVVIDFEYTTPTGAPFEPIEVAVQALHVRGGRLERAAQWEALMRPPRHAELTPFDIGQVSITPDMLAERPSAGEVMAELDRRFAAGPYAYREYCPNLACIDLIDTVRLARNLYPDLPRHGLDHMLRHLQIPAPANRHRAMADVQVTVELFSHLVTDADCVDLRQLRALAGYPARAAQPEQIALFS
jgi:DNA polymerase III alpha subunit (gram-positive type)